MQENNRRTQARIIIACHSPATCELGDADETFSSDKIVKGGLNPDAGVSNTSQWAFKSSRLHLAVSPI